MTGEAERSPHSSTPGRDFRAAHATHRASEGRGTDEGELLALPFLTEGRLAGEWRVRCRTFQRFVEVVLEARVRERAPTPITVLDVGAGNGWLSYRVTLKGQRATALDMRTPRELRWSRRNHGKRRGTTGLGGRSDEPALHRVPDEGPAGASLASVRAGLAKASGPLSALVRASALQGSSPGAQKPFTIRSLGNDGALRVRRALSGAANHLTSAISCLRKVIGCLR